MSFEEMMAELRTEYLASMPQKVSDIENHMAKKDIDLLRNDFHKLKGSGKTYGLPEVSELGELCEKICLNNKEQVAQMVPLAVSLLKSILHSRNEKRPFDLKQTIEFKTIEKL